MHRRSLLFMTALSLSLACSSKDRGAEGGQDTLGDTTSSTGESDSSPSDTGDTGDTGDTDDPACEEPAHTTCLDEADAEHLACLDECAGQPSACEQLACAPACEAWRTKAELDCGEAHCGVPPTDDISQCNQACDTSVSECFGEPECDPHLCIWAEAECSWVCGGCSAAELDFDYGGGCELPLPVGLFPPIIPFIELELGDLVLQLGQEGVPACDDPDIGGSVEGAELDLIVLCPDECDSFAELGMLRVSIQVPCGP